MLSRRPAPDLPAGHTDLTLCPSCHHPSLQTCGLPEEILNGVLAHSFLKELDLTEGRSTGIPKIRRVMSANGSPEPIFETDDSRSYFLTNLPVHPNSKESRNKPTEEVAGEVTGEVERLVRIVGKPMKRREIQGLLELKHEDHFRNSYLSPALESGFVEMTIPDKPRSSNQKYRLTPRGERLRKGLLGEQDR